MVVVLADESLYRFIGGHPPDLDELRARYGRLVLGHSADGTEEWRNWIVRDRAGGRAVGTLQATIVDDGRGAEVAWMIGGPWQHRGFASEAVQALVSWLDARGVPTITAHVHPDHHASAAVAARAGLSPTDEIEGGERLWRRSRRAAETSDFTNVER